MSQNAIDIDIGGTFTDCYITHADRRVWCKARTTAYDLTVCMTEAIEDGAGRIGLTTEELLADTDIIRYSSTLAMNKLIERGGPPIALIMTHGFEDTIFIGRGSQWADGVPFKFVRNIAGVQRPEPLIDRSMVVGVHERIDLRQVSEVGNGCGIAVGRGPIRDFSLTARRNHPVTLLECVFRQF